MKILSQALNKIKEKSDLLVNAEELGAKTYKKFI